MILIDRNRLTIDIKVIWRIPVLNLYQYGVTIKLTVSSYINMEPIIFQQQELLQYSIFILLTYVIIYMLSHDMWW